ncbi:cytochrome P450 [Paucibacter soli]|uniref:cytochrome P450 n=1 Tax=Paucibacter soli TaxID=3133433 RepID=UPI0030968F44
MDSVAAVREYKDLPGPPGLPLLGNALQIEPARYHRQLEDWAREFGPMYRLRLNDRRLLVVADHEAVAAILRERPNGFVRSRKQLAIWIELGLPVGLFAAEGEVWARQRRMVMAGFDPAHVRHYFPAMRRVAARLVERWQMAALERQAIELQADLMRYTVDTIAGLAFGETVDTLGEGEDVIQRHLNLIFPSLFKRILAPLPLWRMHKSRADRQLDTAVAEVMSAVVGFIAKARERLAADPARRAQPPNLLEAMLVAADQPDSGIDDQQVAGNVLTLLLAGEDTTANTLAWMLHLLWHNPAALVQARQEVRTVIGATPPGEITPEQLAALDYVEACAHETMRLKPVAPVLPLQAAADTVIAGVLVPAETVVVLVMRHDSISAEYFAEPDRFLPERWLGGAGGHGALAHDAKRIAMPFGAGPRICPGRYLALLEIKLAMAALLSRFDITSVATPDGREAQELMAFTMQPVGLTMKLRALAH